MTAAETQTEDRHNDPRYQRLMAVTRLAARAGYDAISMRQIAAASNMSMTTIYQYCSSKDHLIAEAHLEWMGNFRDEMLKRPPRGRAAATRVSTYIDQITSAWETHETLTMTLQRAIYSIDPGVRDVRASLSQAYSDFMHVAIGDEIVPNRESVVEILGHVIDSVTHGWVTGRLTAEQASAVLQRTVSTLLPKPISPSSSRREPRPGAR